MNPSNTVWKPMRTSLELFEVNETDEHVKVSREFRSSSQHQGRRGGNMSADSLRCQDFVIHVIQRGAVSHVKRPEQRVPLLFDFLSLRTRQSYANTDTTQKSSRV